MEVGYYGNFRSSTLSTELTRFKANFTAFLFDYGDIECFLLLLEFLDAPFRN